MKTYRYIKLCIIWGTYEKYTNTDFGFNNFYPDDNLYVTFQNDNIIIIQNEEGEASTSYTFEDNILKIGSTTTEGNTYEFSDKDNFSLLIVYPDGEEATSYFKRVP